MTCWSCFCELSLQQTKQVCSSSTEQPSQSTGLNTTSSLGIEQQSITSCGHIPPNDIP